MIKIEDYDYQLPSELIAQEALKKRDECRLLCVNKNQSTPSPSFVKEGSNSNFEGTTTDIEEKKFKDIANDLGLVLETLCPK